MLSEAEKQAALEQAYLQKVAKMSDSECAEFVAQAEAEKVASQAAADKQAGGRLEYHGYNDAMELFNSTLDECGGDKQAALQKTAEAVGGLTDHYVSLATEKVASDPVDLAIKTAYDEDREALGKFAHELLVERGYKLESVA